MSKALALMTYLQQLPHQIASSCWEKGGEHEAALHNLLVCVGDILIKERRKAVAPQHVDTVTTS